MPGSEPGHALVAGSLLLFLGLARLHWSCQKAVTTASQLLNACCLGCSMQPPCLRPSWGSDCGHPRWYPSEAMWDLVCVTTLPGPRAPVTQSGHSPGSMGTGPQTSQPLRLPLARRRSGLGHSLSPKPLFPSALGLRAVSRTMGKPLAS